MNIRLQNYLYHKFPSVFSKKLKNEITCSDGWFFLLNFTCEAIQRYKNEKNFELEKNNLPPVYLQIDEINEKSGQLNIAYQTDDDKVKTIINTVQLLSNYICEETGVFNETVGKTSKHWIKTVSRNQTDGIDWKSNYNNDLLGIIEEIKSLSND